MKGKRPPHGLRTAAGKREPVAKRGVSGYIFSRFGHPFNVLSPKPCVFLPRKIPVPADETLFSSAGKSGKVRIPAEIPPESGKSDCGKRAFSSIWRENEHETQVSFCKGNARRACASSVRKRRKMFSAVPFASGNPSPADIPSSGNGAGIAYFPRRPDRHANTRFPRGRN